jgi:hypothetical protein
MRASPGMVIGSVPALYGFTGLIGSLIALAISKDADDTGLPFRAANTGEQIAVTQAKAATHEASVREWIIIVFSGWRTTDRRCRTDSGPARLLM